MIDVTIVICTLQRGFIDISKYPVIIVSPYDIMAYNSNITYVKDYKYGMGAARQIGLLACNTEYILYMSDDNAISDETIEKSIEYMKRKKWVGCGISQRIKNAHTYLEKCINIRNSYRFKEGVKDVIGTPFIWNTEMIKRYNFDHKMKYSDDTDICYRVRMAGHKFGYTPFTCYEGKENATLKNIYTRLKIYGVSDRDYFKKYYKTWKLPRIIKSLLHPLQCEFIPNLYYLPFYVMIVIFRYRGYLS